MKDPNALQFSLMVVAPFAVSLFLGKILIGWTNNSLLGVFLMYPVLYIITAAVDMAVFSYFNLFDRTAVLAFGFIWLALYILGGVFMLRLWWREKHK